jgi:hypothetical protein
MALIPLRLADEVEEGMTTSVLLPCRTSSGIIPGILEMPHSLRVVVMLCALMSVYGCSTSEIGDKLPGQFSVVSTYNVVMPRACDLVKRVKVTQILSHGENGRKTNQAFLRDTARTSSRRTIAVATLRLYVQKSRARMKRAGTWLKDNVDPLAPIAQT